MHCCSLVDIVSSCWLGLACASYSHVSQQALLVVFHLEGVNVRVSSWHEHKAEVWFAGCVKNTNQPSLEEQMAASQGCKSCSIYCCCDGFLFMYFSNYDSLSLFDWTFSSLRLIHVMYPPQHHNDACFAFLASRKRNNLKVGHE